MTSRASSRQGQCCVKVCAVLRSVCCVKEDSLNITSKCFPTNVVIDLYVGGTYVAYLWLFALMTSHSFLFTTKAFCTSAGSAITTGREPSSCLGRAFYFKFGSLVSKQHN
jgi:hypothetical protein